MKKVLTIPDLHVPKHSKLDGLYKFIEDFQPTHLVLLGDSLNLDVIGHWGHQQILKNKGLEYVRNTLRSEVAEFRTVSHKLTDKCKNLQEYIYFVGNHEHWIKMYEDTYGNGVGALTLEGLLDPKELGITKIIPKGQLHKIGHITYIHGDNYKGGKITALCDKILNEYDTNVIFGHFHSICETSKCSPAYKHEKKSAKCVGTMGLTEAEYGNYKPNQWQNAFHIAYVRDNGMFNDYIVRVFNGRFIAPNGKSYE